MRKHSGAASSQRLSLHLRHHLRQLRREGSSHVQLLCLRCVLGDARGNGWSRKMKSQEENSGRRESTPCERLARGGEKRAVGRLLSALCVNQCWPREFWWRGSSLLENMSWSRAHMLSEESAESQMSWSCAHMLWEESHDISYMLLMRVMFLWWVSSFLCTSYSGSKFFLCASRLVMVLIILLCASYSGSKFFSCAWHCHSHCCGQSLKHAPPHEALPTNTAGAFGGWRSSRSRTGRLRWISCHAGSRPYVPKILYS